MRVFLGGIVSPTTPVSGKNERRQYMGCRLGCRQRGGTVEVPIPGPTKYGGNTGLDRKGELIHFAFSQNFPKNLIFFQKRTQPWLNLNLYHPSLPLHIFKSPISLIFLEFIPSLLCTIRGCCLFFFFLRDFLPQTFLSLQEPKTSKNHSHTYTHTHIHYGMFL